MKPLVINGRPTEAQWLMMRTRYRFYGFVETETVGPRDAFVHGRAKWLSDPRCKEIGL